MRPAFNTLALLAFLFTAPAAAQDIPLAGPNLSGDAYTALRGDARHPVLSVEVTTNSGASTEMRQLVLGPDYAIERGSGAQTVYDFRFRRLLTLAPDQKQFSNESLFGHAATRFLFLQNNLGMSGTGIATGVTDPSLAGAARFVNEHLNGMRHPADMALQNLPRPDLTLTRDGANLTGALGDMPLLTATLSESAFPSRAHAQSFAAWLAWGGRIHPTVAAGIAETGQLPAQIEFTFPAALRKLNPGIRERQSLSFDKIGQTTGQLDAIRGWTARIPAWPPYLPAPLAQNMVDAANGTAPGGPKSDDDYVVEISALSIAGRHLDAVLLGLHASHPYNGCQGEHRSRPVCAALGTALNKAREDKDVRQLFAGFALESERQYRRAAEIWVRLRLQPLLRKDVLDFAIANALVEAQKRSPLTGEMGVAFKELPSLFTRALAVDPYDPARYRDIYNYLQAAATGLSDRYQAPMRAMAVIDLARALPERPMPDIIRQVVESGTRTARNFPVLFPDFNTR